MKTWERVCPNCGVEWDPEADFHICKEQGCPVVPRAVLWWAVVTAVMTLLTGGLIAWCVITK